MPAQTRFANAHGLQDNYFSSRAEQDAHSKAVSHQPHHSGGIFRACFGCGAASQPDADAPDAKRRLSAVSTGKDSPASTRNVSTIDAASGKSVAPESPAASPSTPSSLLTPAPQSAARRLSLTEANGSPEALGSGHNSNTRPKKPTDALAAADTATDGPASFAATPCPGSPPGTAGPAASALSDVFANWRKPKVRTSEVTPVDDTADEVSPLAAGAAPAGTFAPSASGSASGVRSPRASDTAGSRAGAPGGAADGDAASGAGSTRATPAAGQRNTPHEGSALAQRLIAGLAEQHPGMVTIASFKDDEPSDQPAGGPRTSAPAMSASQGSRADAGQAAAAAASSAGGPGAAAGGASASGEAGPAAAHLEPEPRPTFLRRGASCSGAEPPGAGAGFLIAAAGAPPPALGPGLRGSMARRSSYAGDSAHTNSLLASFLHSQQPGLALSPSPLRPSPSLRPTPLSPQPALQPQPLLQPSPSTRPAPLLGANAPGAPPPPPSLLPQSPSLLRQPPGPPGQQKLMLPPSPSLLRQPGSDSTTASGGAGGGEQHLRLSPQPMLKHNGCSFSRNVSTSTAVAALGALRPLGSMPRHGALAPIASIPSADEAAAALNRLASLQAMHRQKQQEQQQQQQGALAAQGSAQPAPPAAAEPSSPPSVASSAAHRDATGAAPSAAPSESAKPASPPPEQPTSPTVKACDSAKACDAPTAQSSDGESEADSVVGDLPPPPTMRVPPAAAGASGSAAAATAAYVPYRASGTNLRVSESMLPMRRAASDEPYMSCRGAGPGGMPDLAHTLALSDTGGAGAPAAGGAGLLTAAAAAAADGGAAHTSHAAKWLESLQPPATAERVHGPEPIEPLPEPEISAGSLASSSAPEQGPCVGAVPPPAGRVAALRAVGGGDKPGTADSFKCLLEEIEP